MPDVLAIMCGVLAGNLITLLFGWGIWHAFRTPEPQLRAPHFLAMLAPLGVVFLGVIAYA